ncbi:MAG TPA: thiamine pyrophosphate-dependent enzyme, partial [Longimicrobiales bacterium]|nr:thiamine pyrophosphate-dependent enzyme [Longimicrobiales bacterium]
MATKEQEITDAGDLAGLSPEQLLRFYRTMVTSRRIDDREMGLKRQNKIFFQISSAGHEAIGVAVAEHCVTAHDWFFLYYRDRSLTLSLGQTPLEHFLQAVGADADPASGGRQMPAHFGDVRYNIANTSSPTGTQFLQAVGAAEAGLRIRHSPELRDVIERFEEDEIV